MSIADPGCEGENADNSELTILSDNLAADFKKAFKDAEAIQ